jgi:hypothetical protein
MQDKIITPTTPDPEKLKIVYDVLNRICKSDNLFYSKDEIKMLKKDYSNKWL